MKRLTVEVSRKGGKLGIQVVGGVVDGPRKCDIYIKEVGMSIVVVSVF